MRQRIEREAPHVVEIDTGFKTNPVRSYLLDLPLFRQGEYRNWPEGTQRTFNVSDGSLSEPTIEQLRGRLSAETTKGKMFQALTRCLPPSLLYPVWVFEKTNLEGIKKKVQEGVRKRLRVGMPTCYGDGESSYAGQTHWLMGMDNEKIVRFFFGEKTDPEETEREYRRLREESGFSSFHMDFPSRLSDWSEIPELKEIAVCFQPAGHATKQEEHFTVGLYLKGNDLMGEISPLTYHTRSIEQRGYFSLMPFRVPVNGEVNFEDITVEPEKAELMKRTLKQIFSRSQTITYGSPSGETIKRFCSSSNLTAFSRSVIGEIVEKRQKLVQGFRRLQRYGFYTLDLIGKTGQNNEILYLKVFEAKGMNL